MAHTKTIIVPITDLIPHPLQGVYDICVPEEDAKLKHSIEEYGLDVLVEVYRPILRRGRKVYVVRDGWRRLQALRALGRTSVKVRVRLDLPEPETPEGMLAFLRANAERRQLDTVQRVRVAVREYEILHGKGRRLSQSQLQAAREEIGKLVGMSGRNVARYLRVCRAPLPVQRAVSQQRLRLTLAERVADIEPAVQTAIATAIEKAGVDADLNAIVMGLLGDDRPMPDGRRHVTVADALESFARSLQRGLDDLADRVDEAHPRHIARLEPLLSKARQVLQQLVERANSGPR